MSKFSLFTLFLSATIIVIVAELIVNEYVPSQLSANVMQPSAPGTQADSQAGATQDAPGESAITYAALTQAGFKNFSLQRVPFNGILFESIDLRDFKSVKVTVNNLLENNRKRVATFYEFQAESGILAKEVYQYLREKCGKLIGASLNETGSFRESSFYVNYIERTDTAFLVVNAGENVYALTYLKDLHSFVSNLISQIT